MPDDPVLYAAWVMIFTNSGMCGAMKCLPRITSSAPTRSHYCFSLTAEYCRVPPLHLPGQPHSFLESGAIDLWEVMVPGVCDQEIVQMLTVWDGFMHSLPTLLIMCTFPGLHCYCTFSTEHLVMPNNRHRIAWYYRAPQRLLLPPVQYPRARHAWIHKTCPLPINEIKSLQQSFIFYFFYSH